MRTDPKTVQTLLRHSDVKLTLQFYSHAVSQDPMAAAGEMLNAILSHKSGLKNNRAASTYSPSASYESCLQGVL
jgi:hypothetical protein